VQERYLFRWNTICAGKDVASEFDSDRFHEVKRCDLQDIDMMLPTPNETLVTMTAETTTWPVNKDTFFQLPRGAQLLIAYVLINDLFNLQLQKNDADKTALVNVGWLLVRPTTTHGILDAEFPENIWQGFESIEDQIMASINEDEMARYTARKGKSYAWLW
jgi:hypothetical protein